MVERLDLSEDVYKRLVTYRQEDEAVADALDRLAGTQSLEDLADELTEADAESLREAIENTREQ